MFGDPLPSVKTCIFSSSHCVHYRHWFGVRLHDAQARLHVWRFPPGASWQAPEHLGTPGGDRVVSSCRVSDGRGRGGGGGGEHGSEEEGKKSASKLS